MTMTEAVQFALKVTKRKRKEWKEKEQDESRKRNLPKTQSDSKRVS